MNTYCRPLSSGKRFVEQIFFTQSDVGLQSLGIVIDFGNQTCRMHHFFSRWVSLPQSYEHSSFSDNRTFCQYWEPHIVHNRASGMLCKTQSAICFFPVSHKTARLLQPHALLKTSTVLGEQLPMNPLPYSSSWLRMLLSVPFILNQQITQISGSLSSIDQKILMSLPSPLPPHSILVVRVSSLGVGCF